MRPHNRFSFSLIVVLCCLVFSPNIASASLADERAHLQTMIDDYRDLLYHHRLEPAHELLEEITALAANFPDKKAEMIYLEALWTMGNNEPTAASDQFLRARILAGSLRDTVTMGHCLVNEGLIFRDRFPDSTVQTYFQEALVLFIAVQDTHGQISALYELADGNYHHGSMEKADSLLYEAILLSYQSRDWVSMATSLNLKGVVLVRRHEHKESIPYVLASIKLYERLGKVQHLARTLNILGSALYRMDETEKALQYLHQGNQIAKRENFQSIQASILTNLGVINMENGNMEPALEQYFAALDLYKILEDPAPKSACLNNIASLYDAQGKYQLAINYQMEGLKIDRQIADRVGEAISLCNLGEYSSHLEQWQVAIQYYHESEKLAAALKTDMLEPYLTEGLSRCYKAVNDFEKALHYQERYAATQPTPSELKEEAESKTEIWAYEAAKKNRHIQQLENKIEAQTPWLWLGLGFGGITTLLLVGFVWAGKKRAQMQQQKLKHLENDLGHTHQENQSLKENVNQLEQDLHRKEEILSRLQQENPGQAASPEFKNSFLEKVKTQKSWPSFMVDFEMLFPNFLASLKRDHPDLTATDLRLACMIKLSLTTSEVAGFLNITAAGVKKARQRMRKKLNLNADESLNHYLARR